MKVAQIICTFPPYKGGMGNSVYNFAKFLSELGEDITVFTPKYSRKEKNKNENFKIIRLKPVFKFGNAAFVPEIFSQLNDFDIVTLHYPFYGGAEAVLLKKFLKGKKMKLVVFYHMDTTAKRLKGFLFELNQIFITPILIKMADMVLCSSFDYVESSNIAKLYKKHKNKFREIPFGVDLNRFFPAPHENKIKNILFVGGLDSAHYFKGLDVLLKALKEMSFANWRLTIAGDGDLRKNYEDMVKEFGLDDKVEFIGSVSNEDLPKTYREADLFVLPSINKGEAFGLVLLEAMASGIPVIASNLPGVRSVFKENEQGLLIESGNENDLRKKLEMILNDESKMREMGRVGRKLVEEKYDWRKIARKLDDLYRQIK